MSDPRPADEPAADLPDDRSDPAPPVTALQFATQRLEGATRGIRLRFDDAIPGPGTGAAAAGRAA